MPRSNGGTRRANQGFSLIEILVVITIMAALAAGGTVWISLANKHKAKAITNQRLQSLATAIEGFQKAVGYYPPTITREIMSPDGKTKVGEKVGVPNESNIGIESVYVALNLQGIAVNMDGLGDDTLANTDDDQVAELVGKLQVTALYEYVDVWGNPFVYIRNTEYKDASKVEKYVLGNGAETTVAPRKSEKTGAFVREQSFQLFSMGPDGVPGNDDDLRWAMD